MLKIHVEPLKKESFAPYGAYTDFLHPDGYALCGDLHHFFPDRLLQYASGPILHVAQPSGGVPIPDQTHAFLVPRGTMVRINAGVWHLCPLPVDEQTLFCMIALPECTYTNDCTVVPLSAAQQFEIAY